MKELESLVQILQARSAWPMNVRSETLVEAADQAFLWHNKVFGKSGAATLQFVL